MATKKKSDYPTREQAIEFLELAIDNIRDGDIDVPSWEFLRKLIRSEHEQRRGRKRGEQKKVVLGLLAVAAMEGLDFSEPSENDPESKRRKNAFYVVSARLAAMTKPVRMSAKQVFSAQDNSGSRDYVIDRQDDIARGLAKVKKPLKRKA